MDDVILLTDRQLALRLGVSRSFVWKLLASGRLPEPVRLGRAVRWRLRDLRCWEEAGCPARDSAAFAAALGGRDA